METADNAIASVHKPVLLHEVVNLVTSNLLLVTGHRKQPATSNQFTSYRLPVHQLPVFLDGTLGGCGHALAVARALAGKLTLVGLDMDPQAVARARILMRGEAEKVIIDCVNFRHLDTVLDNHGLGQVDLILLDLGLSSDELGPTAVEPKRGFSFQRDEPLIMTFGDPSRYPFTAKDIVNGWKEEDIANVIFAYGEERFSRRIARAIVNYREKKGGHGIETSGELAEVVKNAVPIFYRHGRTHPATKTFQGLRIAVNDELNALKEGLAKGYERLARGGRMAVISFHSLEDRIVKDFYKEKSRQGASIITKKPIRASAEEVASNPRSRGAKLRAIEKI